MNNIIKCSFFFLVLILIVTGCSTKSDKTTDTIEYKNNIFNEDLNNNLIEIDFFYGDDKIIINNGVDMYNIFNIFSSLTLTKSSNNKELK